MCGGLAVWDSSWRAPGFFVFWPRFACVGMYVLVVAALWLVARPFYLNKE